MRLIPSFFAVLALGSLRAQMTGSYTVDPSGSGNYTTISAAVADLHTLGVSGPVTINIAPGVYPEQVSFQSIAGASATNTVTLVASTGLASDVEIGPAPNGTHTIDLGGAQRVTLRSLSVLAADKGLIGSNPRYCKVEDCVFIQTFIDPTSTAIQFERAQNTELVGNYISGTERGIILGNISGSQASQNVTIADNTIGCNCEAIRTTAITRQYVQRNTCYLDGGCTSGANAVNVANASGILRITDNKVVADDGQPCLEVQGFVGTSNQRGRIVNNMLVNNAQGTVLSALAAYDCLYIDIYHNSMLVKNTFANVVATFSSGNLRFRGNILKAGDDGYYCYMETPVASFTFNQNLYYAVNGASFSVGANFYSFATWQAAGNDVAGAEADPLFVSDDDLHITNASPAHSMVPLTLGVGYDIEDQSRPQWSFNTMADAGCDESVQIILPLTRSMEAAADGSGQPRSYPNPVVDRLRIDHPHEAPLPFAIFHVDGRTAMSGSLYGDNSIDLSGLGNGNYILHIQGAAPQPFVVQH